ncbi:MAG: hypothetical protein P8N50_00405 [Actinomycetota bacterium]|nr:hypothetical protein [Actinomycetota bacterium]
MAWCDACDRYLTPSSLDEDGTCPGCDSGDVLVEVPEMPHTPWHFKLLVVLAGGYLLWRSVFGVIWLFERLG